LCSGSDAGNDGRSGFTEDFERLAVVVAWLGAKDAVGETIFASNLAIGANFS